jgi:spore coat protein H
MRHSRPSPNARSAGMTQPIPPAPPKPPAGPPSHRKAWIVCGVLLAVAVALYWYFRPRPKPEAEPVAPPTHSSTGPAAADPPAGAANAVKAVAENPVQRVANAGLPPAPVPPKRQEPPVKETKKDKKKEEEKEKERETKQHRKQIDDFFAAQPLPRLMFKFIPEEWEYLKKDPRRYADAMMIDLETEEIFKGVAVKCKGSAGSFQGPEQRPGLTVSMNKYKGAERWHGFLKFHLNNSVQDGTYLMEQIAGEMARAAGVPASRCAHVLLKWQGRDMGMYVFKEAFDLDFLSHFYKNPEGDLYDGGFVREIDMSTEKDQGEPMQRENLRELIAASQEPNLEKRWARLEKILDVDEYLSFTAIESLTCHWDGYNFNRNNYRFYFDVTTGKAQFFLHGTDQTFGDVNFPVTRDPGSLVGGAVMSNPAWKKGYRDRVEKIYQEVLKPIDWPGRVTEIGEKVKADLEKVNPALVKDFNARMVDARNRVTARIAAVGKQLGDMPKPVKFDEKSLAALTAGDWQPQGPAAAIDTATRDGKTCLHIRADGETSASWRKTVSLPAGRYRFEARLVTAGVVGSKTPTGDGAGLRISGGSRTAPNALTGDSGWQETGFDIETPGGDVVLVAELRATKGDVWFDRDSLRLRQVK